MAADGAGFSLGFYNGMEPSSGTGAGVIGISGVGASALNSNIPGARRFGGVAFLTCLALLLLLQGCNGASSAPEGADERPAIAASLHDVGARAESQEAEATGTIRLRRETPLAFVTNGRVASIAVREGDVVRAGQLLAALDPSAIDSALSAAEARASQASAELQRQKQLAQQGWVSTARVESAEAAYRASEAERSAAAFNRRHARITAPADGVVLSRLAEPGQTVAAGEPVLVLGEYPSGHVLRVPLPAALAAGLETGRQANVHFPDGAAPDMAARIIEVAGRADPATGTFQVEFALPAHPALRSGMIASVRIAGAGGPAPLMVPATAIFSARADEGFVWVVDPGSGRIAARLVTLGRVSDAGVEILGGLARGERIVSAGIDRLAEGDRVRPAPAAPAAAAPAASVPVAG